MEANKPMRGIQLADIELLAAVTFAACLHMATFAKRVGNMRMKHKVNVPQTEGPPEFTRCWRAQQNSVEFFGVFIACLWTAGLFFHQESAAVVGMFFIIFREFYFRGYTREAKQRRWGFSMATRCLVLLVLMIIMGLGSHILLSRFQIDVKTPSLRFLRTRVYRPGYAYLHKTVFAPAWAFIQKNLVESDKSEL